MIGDVLAHCAISPFSVDTPPSIQDAMKLSALLVAAFAVVGVVADDFAKLDEAQPSGVDLSSIYPVFDIDTDSCLFSAGISRNGEQNEGLKPTGTVTGSCRSDDFLNLSNLYHRYACLEASNVSYCGHFFSVYTLKDQIVDYIESGHRHDWEKVILWTEDGDITFGSYSEHSSVGTAAVSDIPKTADGRLKFVFHKSGALTHCFRFAKDDEGDDSAENPSGKWFTPTIASWYTMKGDDVSNDDLRAKLNSYDYGSAHFPNMDAVFLDRLNEYKPSSFPNFTQASVDESK